MMNDPPAHPPAPERSLEYDLDALRKNIDRCKGNVETFEDAIQKEHDTIKQLWHMISEIETKRERER